MLKVFCSGGPVSPVCSSGLRWGVSWLVWLRRKGPPPSTRPTAFTRLTGDRLQSRPWWRRRWPTSRATSCSWFPLRLPSSSTPITPGQPRLVQQPGFMFLVGGSQLFVFLCHPLLCCRTDYTVLSPVEQKSKNTSKLHKIMKTVFLNGIYFKTDHSKHHITQHDSVDCKQLS